MTPLPTAGPPKSRPSRRTSRGLLGILAGVLATAAMIGVYFGANSSGGSVASGKSIIPGETKPWKIEVVNVTGVDGVANRTTAFLRSIGYDVVDYHSRPLQGAERCMVIDRRGNPAAAKDIAAALGLPDERVRTALDASLFVDATVVVAYDAADFPVLRRLTDKGR